VEVGGTSTFVTHDVTKVEVRWAETHLKLKSHAPKERGCLTPRTSAGLSCPGPARAQGRAPGWPCWPRAGPGPGHGHGPDYGRGRGRGSKILTFPILDVFRFSIGFPF
jgi:hypothetical protein